MVILEKTSVDRIKQIQRVLLYYYSLNSDIDVRSKWIELSQCIKTSDRKVFEDAKTDCDFIVDNLSSFQIINTEEATLSKEVFPNVISIIKRESNWEKKAYDYLDSRTKDHPLVSKLIIVLLSGLLTGLFSNIVYDAVKNDDASKLYQNTIFVCQNQQMKEIFVDKDGYIKIRDASEFMINKE